MTDETMQLAGEFPPVTHQQWLDAVDKVLKGRDFDRVLRSATPDGIVVEPLYTSDDARAVAQVPAAGVNRRASGIAGLTAGWDVRQRHGVTDPAATNAAILADLTRGVTSIELMTDGIDVAALDDVLAGVHLEMAPISLLHPDSGLTAGRALLELAASRGVPASELHADLGCDPIGRMADQGSVELPVTEAMAGVGALAAAIADTHPGVRITRADGAPYAEAGATPATELAAVVATALAHLRAATEAGVAVDAALRQILLAVTVGTDQFGDMAKLRALRVMWARVGEVVGHPDVEATIQATTAASAATLLDPWVNMLRVTIGCFAAATGGADIVVVRPFDAVAGVPDDLGLRVARNTQLTLMEESNLHRVIDPAGGSWYVESLTDALAAEAWSILQDIEGAGGIIESLRAGSIQSRVREAQQRTADAVATRRRPVTGVSEFPHIDEDLLERPARAEHPVDRVPAEAEPLAPHRLAEPYERLRLAARAADPQPVIFLANLGPVAVHTARASWARNAFEAGGIRAIDAGGHDDDTSLAEAFRASGARLAVLCSSDDVYAERAASAARALVDAGAARVYLAGNPGERRDADVAAGVDEFVHVGVDILATLSAAHEVLGLGSEEDNR